MTVYWKHIKDTYPDVVPWNSNGTHNVQMASGWMASHSNFLPIDGLSTGGLWGGTEDDLYTVTSPFTQTDVLVDFAKLMKEWDVVSIEAVCEGQEFLGWVAHEQTNMVDENGFEEYTSVKLFDGKLFTTEEVLEMELPEKNISFYTVWNLICGGCEERKVCEVFYIDDDIYYVCDDCYEEFAHGMGLE